MKGSEIIEKIGVNQVHCSVEKEMLEIDPEGDYAILKGTDDHPRVICEHHLKMIQAGKYPRLEADGLVVVNTDEWTTGHNAFEGDVEPKFSPERPNSYMTQ